MKSIFEEVMNRYDSLDDELKIATKDMLKIALDEEAEEQDRLAAVDTLGCILWV